MVSFLSFASFPRPSLSPFLTLRLFYLDVLELGVPLSKCNSLEEALYNCSI